MAAVFLYSVANPQYSMPMAGGMLGIALGRWGWDGRDYRPRSIFGRNAPLTSMRMMASAVSRL